MFFPQETAQCRFPVYEAGLTASEIEELLSLLQDGEPASPNSGSEGTNRAVYSLEEKKLRRMISNRESARRSRWRKKKHLENITSKVNRMRLENGLYKNRLGLVMHLCQAVRRENDRLRFEYLALQARLLDLNQIFLTMQLQYNSH